MSGVGEIHISFATDRTGRRYRRHDPVFARHGMGLPDGSAGMTNVDCDLTNVVREEALFRFYARIYGAVSGFNVGNARRFNHEQTRKGTKIRILAS